MSRLRSIEIFMVKKSEVCDLTSIRESRKSVVRSYGCPRHRASRPVVDSSIRRVERNTLRRAGRQNRDFPGPVTPESIALQGDRSGKRSLYDAIGRASSSTDSGRPCGFAGMKSAEIAAPARLKPHEMKASTRQPPMKLL